MPGKRPPRKRRRFISLKTLAARAQLRSSAVHYIIRSSASRKWLTFLASAARQSTTNSILTKTSSGGTLYNVKTDGNAHGDGSQDDTAHILAAITAYKAAGKVGLYFPEGTYLLSTTLTIPSGTVMIGPTVSALAYPVAGCNTPASWLKGKVIFGSNSTFSDLRIGNSGTSNRPTDGATNTSFTRCQFRGGGGAGTDNAVILMGQAANSCNHVTFTDCNFERNVSTLADNTTWGTNIFSINNLANSGGAQIDYITWERCHFGVDNDGANTITPRAGIECTNKGVTPYVKGYHHMSVIDCVFEQTGWFTIDFADDRNNLSHDVIIHGNLIKGAGAGPTSRWGYAICLEMPVGTIVENNLIYRCTQQAIKYAYCESIEDNTIIRNNTLQLDVDNGITSSYPALHVYGGGSQIYGNTIVMNYNQRVFYFYDGAHDIDVYSNTITNKYAGASPETWAIFSHSDSIRVAGTGLDSTRNTLETYQTSDLGWTNYPASGNTNLTLTPNILIHH